YMLFGGTDCRTMQEICDTAIRFMPCVMTAEQDGRMHAADENFDVDAIGKMVECYKTFIQMYK
ncbi:MAG: M20/M25/M40 family metallo-hydrolase, partial [Clostridia bacterium]|nr:M20/M25/M40 family metallo-hydrolase [Clostridia bacterium]